MMEEIPRFNCEPCVEKCIEMLKLILNQPHKL